MTIEQIRAEIDRRIDECAVLGSDFTCSILGHIKRLLWELEPTWHPYPEEEPSKEGDYLVTLCDGRIAVDSYVTDWFDGDPKATEFYRWGENDEEDVVLWTELPKSHKNEENT